jgi:hypothetical protein
MMIASLVFRVNAAGRHGLTVQSGDNRQLARADRKEIRFLNHPYKRVEHEVQPRLKILGLNTDFTIGCKCASGGQLATLVSPFDDSDLGGADVDEQTGRDKKNADETHD